MPYSPSVITGFGGLNLQSNPELVGDFEALDMLNCRPHHGGLITRGGYEQHTSSELTNRGGTVYPYYESDGTNQLLVGCGTRLEAVNTAGAVVASATGLTDATWRFVRFAAPGSEVAYAGNGNDTLRKWDGASWTAPTATVDGVGALAMPKAGLLAIMPISNRLVASGFATTTGGPNGSATNPSTVVFSDQGAPETWQVTSNPPVSYQNTLQLTPGDGEKITAMVAWRDSVFVFKQSKFFVLYGETIQANGGPVFNYRIVDAGVGCVGANAACAGLDGVYFLNRQGIYRTTGGEPEKVSRAIDPTFTKQASFGSPQYSSLVYLRQQYETGVALTWHRDCLYAAIPAQGAAYNTNALVHNPAEGWWTIYTLPAAGLCSWKVDSNLPERLAFSYSTGLKHIGSHWDFPSTDAGASFSARWRGKWSDYGSQAVKSMREVKVWGFGTAAFQVQSDFVGSGADSNVTFSAGLEPRADIVRVARRGTFFSIEVTNVSGSQFHINRMVPHLRDERVASVKSS